MPKKALNQKKRSKKTFQKSTKTSQRQPILDALRRAMEWLIIQIKKKRISRSKHRLEMIKTLAYVANIYFRGLKDEELDVMNIDVLKIEEQVEPEKNGKYKKSEEENRAVKEKAEC